jgi:hypothetical protein
MARKRVARISGFKERTIWRDEKGHFSIKANRVSEEIWHYREMFVKGKKKRVDLKIEYLPYQPTGHITKFGSITLPSEGYHAGKLIYDPESKNKSPLETVLSQIGVGRHDTRIDIAMTGKTKSGEIVRRKISIWHYNSHKLELHTIGGILNELFYKYGDRPAYPVRVVRGSWRNRQTTKKETMGRRQLYDVTFTIKTDSEKTRKQAAKKKVVFKGKRIVPTWGMDLTRGNK